ncbi:MULTISPECIES: transcriptional regulator [Vibrio]|uniref:transcriptional regulator n=1 Tax=Vibrio TaxID=662 RepID=UPI00211A4ACC|nr:MULTISPECIES: transcriptional regulator [Vibrio]MCQ9037895.1 transcriptional regulator [Vibrio alginolyticus]MDK9743436.1 transcriptional regulator [Vibrio sp. B516a]MDW1924221.1 transcriptional regulator [Vibrio sp. 947]MDW1948880.1 transcriptional regulator [Vibrio sp. 812(2023)]MDW1992070.1 transcriptional regulator [Vibrio sp. 780]
MDLSTWQDQITMWYEQRKHDQVEKLETILYQVPDDVFGPELSDLQSKAITCWLDGCLRVFQYASYQDPQKAYQTLLYTSAKLEQAACQVSTDILIKDWCLRRLQHLTVVALEFCNQQCDQNKWQEQAHSLIESHVALMRSLHWNEPKKHDQGLPH